MKLLSSDLSPYSARVRIMIYAKSLDVDICEPDLPLRSDAFKQKYPMGKIPVLVTQSGDTLGESWSIMEYLEARYPEQPMQSDDVFEKAQMSARARYVDLHLANALFPLFAALLHKTPIDMPAQIEALKAELVKGDRLWKNRSDGLDLADIALAPVMYFTLVTPKVLGYTDNLLAETPALATWWQRVSQIDAVNKGITEIETAFKAMAG